MHNPYDARGTWLVMSDFIVGKRQGMCRSSSLQPSALVLHGCAKVSSHLVLHGYVVPLHSAAHVLLALHLGIAGYGSVWLHLIVPGLSFLLVGSAVVPDVKSVGPMARSAVPSPKGSFQWSNAWCLNGQGR